MKSNKKYYLIYFLIALFLFNNSFAQKKVYPNTLKFATNSFYIKDRYKSLTPIAQIGGIYERRIYENWNIGIGYIKWNNWKSGSLQKYLGVGEPLNTLHNDTGELIARYNYKMIDIYCFYKYRVYERHFINLGLGVSYSWGNNVYLKSITINPGPPPDGVIYNTTEKENYYGIIPHLSYNYLCFRNRLSLGLDIRGRHYFKRSPPQYDYGFHVGFNF